MFKLRQLSNKVTPIAFTFFLNVCFIIPHNSDAQDGSLDLSFDTDGIVTTDIGSNMNIAYATVIQPDGKIVVAGLNFGGTDDDFSLVRYNPYGSLDRALPDSYCGK